MFIDQILYPVEVLGPGKRIGIWLVGCARKCPGCSNPELWSTDGRISVPVNSLLQSIRSICSDNPVDGFTITGGEPMLQAAELFELVTGLMELSEDILVFSGFTYEELEQTESTARILDKIAVLVDGPYIEEKNERLTLRGSSNQRVLLLKPEFENQYIRYLTKEQSCIQNMHFPDITVSVGIHAPHFSDDIIQKLQKRKIRRIDHGSDEMA